MSAEVADAKSKRLADVSWAMLLWVTGFIATALHLLGYIVVYTEGEVMQGLFTLLVWIVGGLALVGFFNRRLALWTVVLLGGSLLVWQAFQVRKWAVLHEEVVAIIHFAETTRTQTGQYPGSLKSYDFKNDWVKSHVYEFMSDETNGMRIIYFMNNPGITYWYASQTGFGYYPD